MVCFQWKVLDYGNNPNYWRSTSGTDGTAATNKNYVDARVGEFDEVKKLRSVETNLKLKMIY